MLEDIIDTINESILEEVLFDEQVKNQSHSQDPCL